MSILNTIFPGTHAGSWYGLPDWGLTETAAGLVSGGKTTDLSQALTGSTPTTQYQTPVPQITGGSTTTPYNQYQTPVPTAQPTGGTSAPAPSNGFSDQIYNQYYAGWDRTAAEQDWKATGGSKAGNTSSGPSYEDIMRGQIESGWNDYFRQLDEMMGGLEGQRANQEGMAQSAFNTNVGDLSLQRDQNMADLDTQRRKTEGNQVKTLKDISSNIRNLMQAGNTYLGARGAGDSSAVNQYAYALTKLGSKQRGDVQSQTANIMSEIDDRASRLSNVFMQEKNRLQGELDQRIGQISEWFMNAQNQLKQAKAEGSLSKSQDMQQLTTNLYNTALQQLNNIQNTYNSRNQALESWAISNAENINQIRQNMGQVAQFQAPQLGYNPISGTPQMDQQGNMAVKFGGGGLTGLTDDQKRLLGLA